MNILRDVSFDAASEMRLQSFKKLAPVLFKRDNCTCSLCGFRSKNFLRILPFSGENVDYRKKAYSTPSKDTFRTVCALCYEANRLDYALNQGLGKIIYFPELDQTELNLLFHTSLNITQEDASQYDESVKKNVSYIKNNVKREFMIIASREKALLELFGAANGKELVSFISQLSDAAYEKYSTKIMSGLRYLPDIDAYAGRGKKWKEEAYKDLAIPQWEALLESSEPELYGTWLSSISNDDSEVVFPRINQ